MTYHLLKQTHSKGFFNNVSFQVFLFQLWNENKKLRKQCLHIVRFQTTWRLIQNQRNKSMSKLVVAWAWSTRQDTHADFWLDFSLYCFFPHWRHLKCHKLLPSSSSAMFSYSALMFNLVKFCEVSNLTSKCLWVKSVHAWCVVFAMQLDITGYSTNAVYFYCHA